MTEDEIDNQLLDLASDIKYFSKCIKAHATQISDYKKKIVSFERRVAMLMKQKQRLADERREKGRMI